MSARLIMSQIFSGRRLTDSILPCCLTGLIWLPPACAAALKGKTSETLTLGYVGGIIPQKGLDVLLSAFMNIDSDRLRLQVVGGFFGDEQYQRQVRKLIDSDSRIELVGRIEPQEVFSRLQQFDVLCLPSLVPESFSLVFHEDCCRWRAVSGLRPGSSG